MEPALGGEPGAASVGDRGAAVRGAGQIAEERLLARRDIARQAARRGGAALASAAGADADAEAPQRTRPMLSERLREQAPVDVLVAPAVGVDVAEVGGAGEHAGGVGQRAGKQVAADLDAD